MNRSILLKEAIKTALSFVLVYYIGLKVSWMNPYWAAWAVAMIAMPSATGAALHKGLLRIFGSIPGGMAAIVIYMIAPQSRWLFLLLTCLWIFFTTYMMLVDKKRAYFWNVSGFVALIILLFGPGGSESVFEHAVYRVLETAMGVIVYTLISLFIWPSSTLHVVNSAAASLIEAQKNMISTIWDSFNKNVKTKDLPGLQAEIIKLTGQFSENLIVEGSESYRVQEVRKYWDQFQKLAGTLSANIDRLSVIASDFPADKINSAITPFSDFFEEIKSRLEHIQDMLHEKPVKWQPSNIPIELSDKSIDNNSVFEKGAVISILKQLEKIEVVTRQLFFTTQYITNNQIKDKPEIIQGIKRELPTIDPDNLRGATFVALTVATGFAIWIYFNPVGHASWYMFPGALGMVVAGTPQLKASLLVKPLTLASILILFVYVFIMPHLSAYWELGIVLFICPFIVSYFFKGIARIAGLVAIINNISIQNQQVYDFAAMANGLVSTILLPSFVLVMSYTLNSPRPEKALINRSRRFFRSASFILSTMGKQERTFLSKLRLTFYRQELKTLPGKISIWGHFIDRKLYPENSSAQIQALVSCLQTLVYRIEALKNDSEETFNNPLRQELNDDLLIWQDQLENTFSDWMEKPESIPENDAIDKIEHWANAFAEKAKKVIQDKKTSVTMEESQTFYTLLDGFRGVSKAALEYITTAKVVNWSEWREEKFS